MWTAETPRVHGNAATEEYVHLPINVHARLDSTESSVRKGHFSFFLSNCEIRIEICAKACNLWIAKFNKELKVLNTKNLHFIVENGIKSKVCLKQKI